MKNKNYITVLGWMINDLKLKSNELLTYAIVYGFTQDGESDYKGSTKYLCDSLNISRPTATKCLNELIEKGLITKSQIEINQVTFNLYKITNVKTLQGVKKLYMGSKETLQRGSKETLHSITIKENTKEKDNIYRFFKHLKISIEDNNRLLEMGYTKVQVENVYDSIENFKKNTKYSSLFLTAKAWLKREFGSIVGEYHWSYGEEPDVIIGTKEEYELALKNMNAIGVVVNLIKK